MVIDACRCINFEMKKRMGSFLNPPPQPRYLRTRRKNEYEMRGEPLHGEKDVTGKKPPHFHVLNCNPSCPTQVAKGKNRYAPGPAPSLRLSP